MKKVDGEFIKGRIAPSFQFLRINVDTVYVYDKKRIEVVLRFDDVLQKVISEYMEGAKGA